MNTSSSNNHVFVSKLILSFYPFPMKKQGVLQVGLQLVFLIAMNILPQ
jgi:hypothetical protein